MLFKLKYIFLILCQIIFYAGTHVLDYFAKNKLGMNRWLMYNSMQWEKKMPVFAIKICVAAIIVVTMAVVVCDLIKQRDEIIKNDKYYVVVVCMLILIAICTLLYFFKSNIIVSKPYYLNMIIFFIIYLLQLAKVKVWKKSEK